MSDQERKYHSIIENVRKTKELLKSQIVGQETAIEEVSDAVMRMAWSPKRGRPGAILFFLGPPATGKTYMAEMLAESLPEYAMRSFDMTQYPSENEGFGLTGLRKGYTNAGEGQLTSFVKRHPKSIIIFDELEKAHTRVQMGLLRMLSAGFLRDECTEEDIDFRETIVIFTSNLGSALYSNRSFLSQAQDNPHQARETLMHVISQDRKIEDGHSVTAIPPEMSSRLAQGSIVLFNKLSVWELNDILLTQIASYSKSFTSKFGVSLNFQESKQSASILQVLKLAPELDARVVKSRAVDLIYDPITDYMMENGDIEVEDMIITASEEAVKFIRSIDVKNISNQLATKHQRIFCDHSISITDKTLKLQFCNARIEKLAKSKDFSDASGIQVDLPEISFGQVSGHHKIKERLREVLTLIKNPDQLSKQGIELPRGMLLYGVPGTGKTLLAKAFAHEADLPFLACSGNDLLNEGFIRDLFARAREYAPAIVFIDEVDALPRRGVGGPQADALVNRMLVEIDGFNNGGDDIFVIAATNRKELIDPAILRSGRIDLHFEVPALDKEARRWFIGRMLEKPFFDTEIDIEKIILLTAGFSGADLQKVEREAVLFALREGMGSGGIKEKYLIERINIQKYGQPLDLENIEDQLAETAYHEAAHAVISYCLLPDRRIEQITVVARSDFMGMVAYDLEQKHDYTRDFLFKLTCVALAGRAAQCKQFSDRGLDSGAESDLKQAMHYAWLAIAQWGMSDSLYNVSAAALQDIAGHAYFHDSIEKQVSEWITSATEKTETLINENWCKIEAVAQRLLRDEVIDRYDLSELMECSQKYAE